MDIDDESAKSKDVMKHNEIETICFSNFSIHFKIDQGVQPRFLINPQLNNKLNDDDRHIAIIQCRVM